MRLFVGARFYSVALLAGLWVISGCGYHTLGAATHLPPDVKTISVPLFLTRTEAYHTETVMTNAVIREFATRTRFRITPAEGTRADAVLRGTILKEAITPLTYNSSTQQSSSFLITIIVSVTLAGSDGKVLYQNPNYVYREQYQATTDLATFIQEDPAAVDRMSRTFAHQLVADILESF
jgi:outer membrane lipopolysaccharide assembly protein LptE/RlpB